MRSVVLTALALAACADESQQRQHALAAAVRGGLDRLRGEPGGSMARFADVRLFDSGVVCGRVDGQDGGGLRRFASTAQGVTIEGSGVADAVAVIQRVCAGPSHGVTSRNPAYSDIMVAEAVN